MQNSKQGRVLNEQEIDQWRNQGYVIASGIVQESLMVQSQKHMQEMFEKKELLAIDFGSQGKLEFPSRTPLDHITLHQNIISSVKKLLKTDEILLAQSDGWGKIGKEDFTTHSNNDQRMHMDYGNNTFLHPAPWNEPQTVAIIVYLSDIKQTGGGTSVVARQGQNDELYQRPYVKMPGQAGIPFMNDRTIAQNYFKENDPQTYQFRQKLYEREVISKPNFADILFYRFDIWHRGTPVLPGKVRFVMNLLFKKAECTWINVWNPGWTKWMYYGDLQRLIEQASVEQRAVIGIPKPGHHYWNQERVKEFHARYKGMDITPYLQGLKK